MEGKKYLLGLDLGMMQDFSALSMIEQVETVEGPDLVERLSEHYEVKYHLVHLQRFPLGTQYPEVINRVKEIVYNPEIENNHNLVVDATGIGTPIVQAFRERDVYPVSITITGGEHISKSTEKYEGYNVPKRHLVSALMKVVQGGRLKIAEDLEFGPQFEEEVLTFHYTLDKATGHDSYESARTAIHDDLVLSVALALWYGVRDERHMEEFFRENYDDDEERNKSFNYLDGTLE